MYRINTDNDHMLIQIEESEFPEYEERIETWVANNSECIAEEGKQAPLIIGRQVDSEIGLLDLLAVDANGDTIVIECKQHAPRTTLAQAIGYAACVRGWGYEKLASISEGYLRGVKAELTELDEAFRSHFRKGESGEAEPQQFNRNQRIVIVGKAIPRALELQCDFLHEQGVDIAAWEMCKFESKDGQSFVGLSRIIGGEPTRPVKPVRPSQPLTSEEFREQCEDRGTWRVHERIMNEEYATEMHIDYTPAGYCFRAVRQDDEANVFSGYTDRIQLNFGYLPKDIEWNDFASRLRNKLPLGEGQLFPLLYITEGFTQEELDIFVECLKAFVQSIV